MGTSKPTRTTKRRPVYINGTYCRSLSAAAIEASHILGKDIEVYQIQRAANGELKINGIKVNEIIPEREADQYSLQKTHKSGEPLLRYLLGEKPLDRGLQHWR